MKIYIDSEYKCHVLSSEGLREFDVPFFNGKCNEFIEGYRYVPLNEFWEREDGVVFGGEMVSPWKNYDELYRAQAEYEHQLLLEYESALTEIEIALGVTSE